MNNITAKLIFVVALITLYNVRVFSQSGFNNNAARLAILSGDLSLGFAQISKNDWSEIGKTKVAAKDLSSLILKADSGVAYTSYTNLRARENFKEAKLNLNQALSSLNSSEKVYYHTNKANKSFYEAYVLLEDNVQENPDFSQVGVQEDDVTNSNLLVNNNNTAAEEIKSSSKIVGKSSTETLELGVGIEEGEVDEFGNPSKRVEYDKIKTQKVEYSTMSPLFGVQVGAFKIPRNTSDYTELKKVDAYFGDPGIYRYVTSLSNHYGQAQKYLETVKQKGYPDAFIVNVNTELYSNRVVNLNAAVDEEPIAIVDAPTESSIPDFVKTEGIVYAVQLLAVKGKLNDRLISKRVKGLGKLQKFIEKQYTIVTLGAFTELVVAREILEDLYDVGFKDVFVVAFVDGKKIPLSDVVNFQK